MSAAIFWQAVKGMRIDGGSTLAAELRLPSEFGDEDTRWLEGFSAGTSDMAARQAVNELIEAIRTHGRVRVWAEY